MNPILAREVRSRWRDGRAFGLVFTLSAGLSLLFAFVYASWSSAPVGTNLSQRFAILGHEIFAQLAWIETLAWLLISPALTSSSIAYEREHGWFDALLLTPLHPRQVALGKWSGALLYAATLYVITLPFVALTFLMGGVSPAQFGLVLLLHTLCACCGSAMGLAASAWSYRSNIALRSAYGLLLIWLIVSCGAAVATGQIGRIGMGIGGASDIWYWIGLTNPVLRATEITDDDPMQRWPLCMGVLSTATLFYLSVAVYYARQSLTAAPYIGRKRSKSKTGQPTATLAQIPLVTALKFQNPILNREVRSHFRMRQPPLAVIVAEALLGVLVAYFYLRTLWAAWFDPSSRELIWWGLIWTGFIVTMMASAVMGGNGFSRERESGTWEGLRLSLLRPDEVLRGKVLGSMLTCLLFSIPVWPLLLPCIHWSENWDYPLSNSHSSIYFLQVMGCFLVWLATIWSFTLIGLWVGRNSKRSSRASGQTLGLLGAFIVLSFLMGAIGDSFVGGNSDLGEQLVMVSNPLAALAGVMDSYHSDGTFDFALPYFCFHLAMGAVFWLLLKRTLQRELSGEKLTDESTLSAQAMTPDSERAAPEPPLQSHQSERAELAD